MKSTVWFQILLLSSAVVALPYAPTTSCQWNRGPSLRTSDQSILASEAPDQSVQSSCEPLNTNATPDTLIGKLWRTNCDLVEKFLNNDFAAKAVQNVNYDDAVKYYLVQDYYYLLLTAPNKAYFAESRLPAPQQLRGAVDGVQKDIDYARNFRQETLIDGLKIAKPNIDGGSLNAASDAYVRWLQANMNFGWYAFQVSKIACVYGWGELAHALKSKDKTNKDTLFYKNWVEPNSKDWGYGDEMLKKLQGPVPDVNSDTFKAYNTLFRQGMEFEIAFFESAIGKKLEDSVKDSSSYCSSQADQSTPYGED